MNKNKNHQNNRQQNKYKLTSPKKQKSMFTTRKQAFSNRFRDRNFSVALETELETDFFIIKVKKIGRYIICYLIIETELETII